MQEVKYNSFMKNYVILTLIGAAVIEFASEFLPVKADSRLRKYFRYILSLVLALAVVSPVAGLFYTDGEGVLSVFDKIPVPDTSMAEYPYIYVTQSCAYKADENGNPDTGTVVFIDMYIMECAQGIIDRAQRAVSEKFAVDTSGYTFGIALDQRDTQSIDIICMRFGGEVGYLARDISDYLSNELGCAVYNR